MADDHDDERDAEQTMAVDYSTEALGGVDQGRAYLIVLSGRRIGEMLEVTDGLIVGRGSDAGFQVDDEGVSRVHICLNMDKDGTVMVKDLGSSNGTRVNGERVNSAVLRDGDKILIGTTTILKFSYADKIDEIYQQQMYDSALRDPLTGLYNRRYFLDQLEAELSYARRHQTPLSLTMIDLDHFKTINDTHGHPTGDQVLVAFARLLRDAVRTEDLTARYGGEEFVLVCRGLPQSIAEMVADRLRLMVESRPLVEEPQEIRITISAGVATAPHPEIGEPQDLIKAADEALYEAKRTGRNRVCVASKEKGE